MNTSNRKRKDILDHRVVESKVSSKKARAQSSVISSGSSTSVKTSQWLPPISSLLSSMHYHDQPIKPPPSDRNPIAFNALPMIPYFFHHKQFGLEACMNQLEYQRQYQYRYYQLNDNDRFYPF